MFTFADRKGGFPHSEIAGSKGARASPALIAACHVLHRLSVPRHPSEALMRLIVLSKTHAWGQMPPRYETRTAPTHALCIQTMMSSRIQPVTPGGSGGTLQFTMSDAMASHEEKSRKPRLLAIAASLERRRADGGARRDRTDDLMLAKHPLYQLSYGPSSWRPATAESRPFDPSARPGCHT